MDCPVENCQLHSEAGYTVIIQYKGHRSPKLLPVLIRKNSEKGIGSIRLARLAPDLSEVVRISEINQNFKSVRNQSEFKIGQNSVIFFYSIYSASGLIILAFHFFS
jgi:hypothetical protein